MLGHVLVPGHRVWGGGRMSGEGGGGVGGWRRTDDGGRLDGERKGNGLDHGENDVRAG